MENSQRQPKPRALPPLNPLKAFEVAGRLLSVSKAGQELHVTAAAVSRQVKALEDFLGVQLFVRAATGLQLTAVGARYLSEVSPVFGALRDATNIAMGGAQRRNVLKIRSPATFAVRWLIPRLASFHRDYPDIDVQLSTSPAPLDFLREDIDAGVELGGGQWPGLKTQALVPNILIPVVAPHRAVSRVPKRPRDLAHETLLHSMARPDDWSRWLKAVGQTRINGYRGMKYETSLLAYQAAIEGHGVALAQRALVERDLAQGALVAMEPALDLGPYTYYFAWPSTRRESRALRSFTAWLASVVG